MKKQSKTAYICHDSLFGCCSDSQKSDVVSLNDSNMRSLSSDSLTRFAYDETTLSVNDSHSLDMFYDVSTIVTSCMHNSIETPLTAQENLLNLGLRGKGLHIGHLNIRGIRSGEKLDQIKMMLHSDDKNIAMLGLSESKLGSDVPDNFLLIENYQCFRKDMRCGAGGLLVYVKT